MMSTLSTCFPFALALLYLPGSNWPEWRYVQVADDPRAALFSQENDKAEKDTDDGSVIGAILAGDGKKAEVIAARRVANARKTNDVGALASSLNLLGMAAHFQEKYADAEQHFSESLALYKKLSDDWNVYVTTGNSLAKAYADLGLFADAEFVWRKLLAHHKAQKSDYAYHDGRCVDILQNLGHLRFYAGQHKNAESYYQQAEVLMRKGDRFRDSDFGYSLWLLGWNYLEEREPAKARAAFKKAIKLDPSLKKRIDEMEGFLLLSQAKLPEAEVVVRNALKHTDPIKKAWEYSNYQYAMGLILLQKRELDEAKKCFGNCLRIRREQYGAIHPIIAQGMENLATVYVAEGNNREAEKTIAKAREIRRLSATRQRKEFLESIFGR